jgi:hypothetical protein
MYLKLVVVLLISIRGSKHTARGMLKVLPVVWTVDRRSGGLEDLECPIRLVGSVLPT